MKIKIWFGVLTGVFIVVKTRAQTLPAQGNKAVGPFSFDFRLCQVDVFKSPFQQLLFFYLIAGDPK